MIEKNPTPRTDYYPEGIFDAPIDVSEKEASLGEGIAYSNEDVAVGGLAKKIGDTNRAAYPAVIGNENTIQPGERERKHSWVVRRSSGELDAGWYEIGRLGSADQTMVVVAKEIDGVKKRKTIPLVELEAVNGSDVASKTPEVSEHDTTKKEVDPSSRTDEYSRLLSASDEEAAAAAEAYLARQHDEQALADRHSRARAAMDNKYNEVMSATGDSEAAQAAADRVWRNFGL